MSRRTQKNVGVIGLGIIGRRVADNLRRRGFPVFVWNRTPLPYPNFVGSPAELAELCDFVQIFVSDDEALLQMVQQMKRSLGPEHVIMAHTTVAPHTMRNAAEIVQRRGAHFLDAPFTGSKIPAEKGELVYYVAGDDAAYKRARRVLEASSKEIVEIGEIGQATTVKIATNMVTAATVQAAAEALALVHNAGVAPEKLAAALRGNASNSGTLAMKLPKMIEGDFDPHFSVKHMLKDVQIAARMARSYGLTLGATEAARDSLLEEANSGRADQDFSSLVNFFFPDGLPGKTAAAATDEDAQAKLDSVDEEAAAQVPREEAAASREAETQAAESKAAEGTEAATSGLAEDAAPDEAVEGIEADRAETTSEQAETVEKRDEVSAGARDADAPAAEATRPKEEKSDIATTPTEDAPASRNEPAEASTPEAVTPSAEDKPSDDAGTTARAESPAAAVEDEPEVAAERDIAAARADDADSPRDERAPSAAGEDTDADGGKRDALNLEVVRDRTPADIDVPLAEAATDEPAEASPVEEPTTAAPRSESSEPEAAAATTEEPPVSVVADDERGGEPPRERRMNGDLDPAAAEPARDREEVAARRGFLSRMFGKGPDY